MDVQDEQDRRVGGGALMMMRRVLWLPAFAGMTIEGPVWRSEGPV